MNVAEGILPFCCMRLGYEALRRARRVAESSQFSGSIRLRSAYLEQHLMKPRNLILIYLAVIVLTIGVVFWHAWSDDSGEALANTATSRGAELVSSHPSTLAPQPVASPPKADAKAPAERLYPQRPGARRRCDDASAERPRVGCGRE